MLSFEGVTTFFLSVIALEPFCDCQRLYMYVFLFVDWLGSCWGCISPFCWVVLFPLYAVLAVVVYVLYTLSQSFGASSYIFFFI